MNTELLIESRDGLRRVPWDPTWEGRRLTELMQALGVPLNTRCGGKGWCSGCRVDLLQGNLMREGLALGPQVNLAACQHRLPAAGPLRLRVQPRALLARRAEVVDAFRLDAPCELNPSVPLQAGVRDTAFAVDIGTTTVALVLLDLTSGELLVRKGAYNAQIRFGDNVLSRIEASLLPGHLEALRLAIVRETLVPLLREALQEAGREPSRMVQGAVAGNTTMLHLLLGEDPSGMGTAPFRPRFLETRVVAARELGVLEEFVSPSDFPVTLLPGYSAFVGADLVAGVEATGMRYDEAPAVLVDIGTNGEMVLVSKGRHYVCATAAGPAFEGAGIACGSRAQEGAVAELQLAEGAYRGFGLRLIGGGDSLQATGLCGTAFVDFLALARRSGLLKENGRYDSSLLERLPPGWVRRSAHGFNLKLFEGSWLEISEADVASLLQAKAAVAAGLTVLLRLAGLEPAQVGRLYLAGGFGLHLNVQHALAVGFFPGFRAEQIRVVGNTALAGAIMVVSDQTVEPRMSTLREGAQVVELNAHPEFEDLYLDHLSLP